MPFISRPNITFCSAVSHGSSSANWNTMPRSWPQPLTSRPSTVTLPPDAVSSPMAMRSAVVLPQPDGPMSDTISPSCTLKLTRLSARTVCTAPSTRSVNCFDISCSVTSPMRLLLASFADARQRFLADVGIDQPVDVARLCKLAERDHLVLQPDQILPGDGEVRVDDARPHALLIDEGRAWIVRLGARLLQRQPDGLVTMGHRVAECLDLRRHEADRILAALGEGLARHQRAEAQKLRQH